MAIAGQEATEVVYEPVSKQRERGETQPQARAYLILDGELFEQAIIGTQEGLNGKLAVRDARDDLGLRGRKVVVVPPRNVGRFIG